MHRLNGQRRVALVVAAIVVLVIIGTVFRTAIAPPQTTPGDAQSNSAPGQPITPSDTVALPPPDASIAPDVVSVSGLHVVGNQIQNGSGQVVQLRGANRSSFEYDCVDGSGFFDGPANQAEVTAMKSWGINTVRLVLNEDCMLGINGIPAAYAGANYQNAVVAYTNLLTSNGLAVIENLHFNAPGTHKATEQEPMADRDHASAFWMTTANLFKANNSVLYEIYNEPHLLDEGFTAAEAWTCWRNGGCVVQGSQSGEGSFTVAGMQELLLAIRATGATNIVVVTGEEWGSDASGWDQYKPVDLLNQMAVGWHSYGDGLSCQVLSCWNTVLLDVSTHVPLIATEIGEMDCGHGYIDPVMNWLDAHASGYQAWSWGAFNCASDPALLTDWNGTPTQTYGSGFRAHLLGLAALPTPTAAAATATATAGATVIPATATARAATATAIATRTSVPSTATPSVPTATATLTPLPTPQYTATAAAATATTAASKGTPVATATPPVHCRHYNHHHHGCGSGGD